MQPQSTNAKPKAYYTPEELRSLLPVGRTQIYKMLKSGQIPCLRLGKKFVIPTGAFDTWLASCGLANPTKVGSWNENPPERRAFLEASRDGDPCQ